MLAILTRIGLMFALALTLGGCGSAGQTQALDDLAITMATEPSPPLAGRPTRLQIEARRGSAALDGAQVTVTRSMPGMEHPDDRTRVMARPLGGGRYEADVEFVMGGRWDLTITFALANEQPKVLTFPVDVEQP